jgi:hypothetical protein
MRVRPFIVLSVLGSSGLPALAAERPDVPKSTAAPTTAPAAVAEANETAGVYRAAFALLDSMGDEDKQRLGLCGKDGCWVVNTPLDAGTLDLLRRQRQAVELARKAAAMPPAVWALNGDAQRMVDLANRAPRLSALLVLQARHELRDGDPARAIDDICAAVALSRHASAETTLLTKMVEIAAWRPAGDLLAQQLPSLPKQLVATLPQRFAQMPRSPTMAQLLRGEKAFARASAKKQGFAMAIAVAGLDGFYDALADGGALPPDEYAQLVDAELAKVSLNPWAKIIGPSIKRSRESLAVFEAKQAMLAAAIDVVLHGEAAVAKSDDPFGDRPFGFREWPGGFELTSALQRDGAPVKLVIGGPASDSP